MLLLGKKLTAQRAYEVGLVSKLFPRKSLLQDALAEIREGMVYPLLEASLPMFKMMVKRNTIDEWRGCVCTNWACWTSEGMTEISLLQL